MILHFAISTSIRRHLAGVVDVVLLEREARPRGPTVHDRPFTTNQVGTKEKRHDPKSWLAIHNLDSAIKFQLINIKM